LSVIKSEAERSPSAEGAKLIWNVQLVPAATVEPQLLVCTKSAALLPAIEMFEIMSGPEPPLVKVIGEGKLGSPRARFPKSRLDGANKIEAEPELLSGTIHVATCKEFEVPVVSVTLTTTLCDPTKAGAKDSCNPSWRLFPAPLILDPVEESVH
jgi:hypothetical protein